MSPFSSVTRSGRARAKRGCAESEGESRSIGIQGSERGGSVRRTEKVEVVGS